MSIFDAGRFVGQVDFAPMLPNDDQLIAYSVGSTVDATRIKPKVLGKEGDEVTNMELVDSSGSTTCHVGACAAKISYRSVLTTVYKLTNSSSERSVPKVYVDHTASVKHDGYTVANSSAGNCVKTATGFARYEFALAPGQEVTFEVEEVAEYTEQVSATYELKGLQRKLRGENSSSAVTFLEELGELIKVRTMTDQLTSIENSAYSSEQFAEFSKTFVTSNLRTILSNLSDVSTTQAELNELNRRLTKQRTIIETITVVQNRLRDNIKGLENVSGHSATAKLLSRYVTDLSTQEDDHIKATSVIAKTTEEVYQVSNRLSQMKSEVRAKAGEEKRRIRGN